MASIAQILGRKPAKYTAGQGIGDAISAGGQYMGQMALEKKNAQALDEARNYKEEQAGIAHDRQVGAQIDAEGRSEEAMIRREERAGEAASAAGAEGFDFQESMQLEGDDMPYIYGINRATSEKTKLGPDPDYVIGEDGSVGRASAGAKSAPTELQAKLGMNTSGLRAGVDLMMNVLDYDPSTEEFGDDGYGLRTFGALGNQLLGKVGDFGNWFQSSQGQKYAAAQRQAGEGIFKAMSGAAGSDAEAQRFYNMFPTAGDRPETIRHKFKLISTVMDSMDAAASGERMPPEGKERWDFFISAVDQASVQGNVNLDTGDIYRDAEGSNQDQVAPVDLSQDDIDYINSVQ